MTIQTDFSIAYPPAEAERGKFVVLDASTITGLPSGSRGRYAVITYPIGSAENAQAIVSSVEDLQEIVSIPSEIEIKSTVVTNTRQVITFAQEIKKIEIFNTNPISTLYVSLNPSISTTFDLLTSTAMPVERYYSTDFKTTELVIGATESSDVRIIGHF